MHYNILEIILSVFFAALIVSVIFRQLNLSVVLGYLFVGALVGPHGLGLVPDSDYIDKLAEFGIVLLMFTVGLEFSIPKLFSLRRAVFFVGGLQVALSVAFTFLIAKFFNIDSVAALVIGSIVAMSSTALVIKQLNDQFELQSTHGLSAVGILLFQDLAVIPLIILIAGFAEETQANLVVTLLWALAKGVFAILLIFVVGRWLLKPFFHFIAKARSIELFTLTVLLVTLTAAWVTYKLGLSYALGAFLAGIMLAETEFRHQIEVEIRPFRDVLLALFFISIGMLTDITTWDDTWVWILLLLSALTIGKMLLIAILMRVSGSTSTTAMRTGIVLAQGGEFGFALLTLAMNENIIPTPYQQVILAALLISIAIAPLLIYFNKQIARFFIPKSKTLHESASQQQIIQHAQELQDHIIICGYGRVGQHIARLLDKVNFPYIGLDLDSELVQRATLAGDNVLYGDGAHPEILKTAGIEHAKAILITLSDHRAAVNIVSTVKAIYPNLPILVRCRDKAELKHFKQMGVKHVIAELFETSLTLSYHLLQIIKLPRERVNSLIQEVRNSDYELMQKIFASTLDEDVGDIDISVREELTPIVITEDAYAVGRKLKDIDLKDLGVEVISIRRDQRKFVKPAEDLKIQANDIIVLFGTQDRVEVAERRLMEGG